jgi:hypothetical protein
MGHFSHPRAGDSCGHTARSVCRRGWVPQSCQLLLSTLVLATCQPMPRFDIMNKRPAKPRAFLTELRHFKSLIRYPYSRLDSQTCT